MDKKPDGADVVGEATVFACRDMAVFREDQTVSPPIAGVADG